MTDVRESLDEIRAKMREGSMSKTWLNTGGQALEMGCGQCGNQEFVIFVNPIETTAQIHSIACSKCKKVLRVTGEGVIDGQGKLRG
jgi:hypothetical protein